MLSCWALSTGLSWRSSLKLFQLLAPWPFPALLIEYGNGGCDDDDDADDDDDDDDETNDGDDDE